MNECFSTLNITTCGPVLVLLVSRHQGLLVVKAPDDRRLVVVVQVVHEAVVADSGVPRGRVVVAGNELSEPVSHPPVGVGVISNPRPHHCHDDQDPDHRAHGTGLGYGDGARLLDVDHHDGVALSMEMRLD